MVDLRGLSPDTQEDVTNSITNRVLTLPAAEFQRYLALIAERDEQGGGEDGEEVEDDDDEFMPDDDEDDDDDGEYSYFTQVGPHGHWYEEVTEPKEQGLALLNGGEFGRVGHQVKSRANDNNVARTLLRRGAQVRPIPREDITSVRAQCFTIFTPFLTPLVGRI